ncbi:glycogen/starch synthase [Leptospira sp. 96542]|nr:glycogen/starch synthase [Leptospira sp. 96542]
MKILHASAEYFPYIKMGGLADMLASLTNSQTSGDSVAVALPLLANLGKKPEFTGKSIPCFLPHSEKSLQKTPAFTPPSRLAQNLHCQILAESFFREATDGKVLLYFFDSPLFRDFSTIYGNPDEHYRFAHFSYACYELSQTLGVDVFHAHDWHAALGTAFQKVSETPIPSVFTIHNLAYQGDHPIWMTGFLKEVPFGLIPSSYDHDGKNNYMKAGILSANQITTVSPSYRNETLAEPNGFGLSSLLQKRNEDYTGILNGIDPTEWNPETDAKIHFPFGKSNWEEGKEKNKSFLLDQLERPGFGLQNPLVGLIGRLTYQKGFRTFIDTFHMRNHLPLRYVVLGSGDENLENELFALSDSFQDKFYFYKGYNEGLAHQIEAASDFFLMPSLFEPCGLNQMYSQMYGTIPIVSRVGGLSDTVSESLDLKYKTGIVFEPNDVRSLGYALERAVTVFSSEEKNTIIQTIMELDWSWELRKKEYKSVYKKAIEEML